MSAFIGANLRLARLYHGLSLAELGDELDVSKQFLSRVETGAEPVSAQLESRVAEHLLVLPDFFYEVDPSPIADEQCHFRKQLTTKVALRQIARARGEMLKRLVSVLDEHLDMPAYSAVEAEPSTIEAIERATEKSRAMWALGTGPIGNMTRTAERAGAVVTRVPLADEVDAVSFATSRPVIVLNSKGRSACRSRFAIAHELGHFALHTGVLTGDKLTEGEANRFASAFLLPRTSFSNECRLAIRGTRLNWAGLKELKLRWGTSKAAILYRGRQLGIFSEEQAKAGYVGLNRHGEALQEEEDNEIPLEAPEVLSDGLKVMNDHFGMSTAAIARYMWVQPLFLEDLLDKQISTSVRASNVVNLFKD
jgi:Zn-dependent peptidase ImmA (M78 family)/transcriptional regulator with XRE-family HTH domain